MDELLSLQLMPAESDVLPERGSTLSLWCKGKNSSASTWCG